MLVHEIVDELRTNITLGKIEPGAKLPSPEVLQQQFGVGRSTVREALKTLEGMGLVTVRKGRSGGTFATDVANRATASHISTRLDYSNLLEFISYRRIVEPNMIRRACQNHTGNRLDRIRHAAEGIDEQPRSVDNYVLISKSFFLFICKETGNSFCYDLYSSFSNIFDSASKLLYEIEKCAEISVQFYRLILEAISAQDSDKGEMLGDAYLVQLEECVRSHLQRASRTARGAKIIKWGVVADLSGPTSSHGDQTAMGMIDAARFLNENGGVDGHSLELLIYDSEYTLAKAAAAYKEMLRVDGLLGIYLQSTGTTIALARRANRDRMLLFTAAISDKLCNGTEFPYHFSLGPTYADMACICINYMKEHWSNPARKPRLVFMYPDNPYGRDPLQAAKPHAEKVGIEVGPDQIVNWPTLDATPQLKSLEDFDPDFVYVTSTALHAAAILRDSKRVGTRAQFFLNIRAFNEELPRLAMGAAEGVYGIQALAPYGANVPGMVKIVRAHDERHQFRKPSIAYVEGWANVLVPMEACKMASESGNLTADGIKQALETLRGFDLGGLMPPITYSPTDHRGCTQARISVVEKEVLVPVTDYRGV